MSTITLMPLPWPQDALAPAISETTIAKHYGKHHKGYVDRVNALIADTPLKNATLEEIVRKTAGDPKQRALFNAAAQTFNHDRYWESLSPHPGKPSADLMKRIKADFGDLDALQKELIARGTAHFASGWVWLCARDGALAIMDTHDADSCILHGAAPLLVLDVWEHAYYLDYWNERERHLRTIVGEALNWEGASERFEALS